MKTYKATALRYGINATAYTLCVTDKMDAQGAETYESARGRINTQGYASMMGSAVLALKDKAMKLENGCEYEVIVHSDGIVYRAGKYSKNEVVLHVFVKTETSERAKVTAITAERSSLFVREARPDEVRTHGYAARKSACKHFFGSECPLAMTLVKDWKKRTEAEQRKWEEALELMRDFAL